MLGSSAIVFGEILALDLDLDLDLDLALDLDLVAKPVFSLMREVRKGRGTSTITLVWGP